MPHEFDFAYYSLRDGFDSILILVSDSPQPIDFAVAFHSLSGRPLAAPTMTIQPHAKLTVDLNKLLGEIASDDADDFAEGSLSVAYDGIGPMPLVGQVTVTNPELYLVYESQMVENDPGMMSEIPAVLNSAWWGLEAGRDATIAVSNVADQGAEADVFLDFQGTRHAVGHHAGLHFRAHETELLSITRLLGDLELSPTQVPEGDITIIARGEVPTLIAHGHLLDPNTGFSTTLSFPLPALQTASALHASGMPIGTAPRDSPYADAGSFIPHVIVRNLAASAQTVTLTIEYPSEEGPAQTVLTPRALAAYTTEDLTLESVMDQLPLPLPFCSIRIQYSGTPGSAIEQVSSVEEDRDLVIDSKLANEGDGTAGSGAYPWHLDDQTESTLFLTNIGDKPSRVGFQVQANGVRYYLTKLRLSPHETRAIDLRKLRDAQEPDLQKNTIPAQATDGSLLWAKFENVPVMGRMVVLQRRKGLASSYSCFDCRCGSVQSFVSVSVSPPSTTALPVNTQQFTCIEHKHDCNGTDFPVDITALATWISSNTGVATIDSTGLATAVGGGSASLSASFTDTQYYWYLNNCVETQITRSASGTCDVDSLAFAVTSNGVPGDSNGVIAKVPFNLQIQARSPGGVVPDTRFNSQNVPFTLINQNATIGESAPASVNFSSGTANAGVTVVAASGSPGAPSSIRTIVVSAATTGTIFYPLVYWQVTMDEEVWHNCGVTTCPDPGAYACQTSCALGDSLRTRSLLP